MEALVLSPWSPAWQAAFEAEAAALRGALGPALVAIHHIGSTAIPGMIAKPVIDILCEVTSLAALDRGGMALAGLGYDARGENGIAGRRYFRKCDPAGRHSHQLHAFASGAAEIARHLAFRDYLRAHPRWAEAYAAAKRAIAGQGPISRKAYQAAKDDIVGTILREALARPRP